jgi:hypothetical protein
MDGGRNAINTMKDGKWVIADNYYTASTCSTFHMGSFIKSNDMYEIAVKSINKVCISNISNQMPHRPFGVRFHGGLVF